MAFTVTRQGGTKDAEFLEYVRLLRRRGVDLGKLPRVLEPGTGRRWLYVWNSQPEAEAFAKDLTNGTGDTAWHVMEVNVPASEGPLGPLVIQMVRQADGLTFALHPLSKAIIRSAFPDAVSAVSFASIDLSTWTEFSDTKGGLNELVQEIAPGLTGLDREQLAILGYVVVDSDSHETLLSVPPAVEAPA